MTVNRFSFKAKRGEKMNSDQHEERLPELDATVDGEEERPPVRRKKNSDRRFYSISALALLISYVIVMIFREVIGYLAEQHPTGLLSGSGSTELLISSAVMYLIGMPLAYLILRILPKGKIRKSRLTFGSFAAMLAVAFPAVFIGNMIGNTLSALLTSGNAENSVVTMVSRGSPLTVIVLTVAAPLFEELIFRKAMLDRLSVCGEKWALVFSALCFGLYHMNLFQFFYAFGIGIVFGYAYLRTGKIIYSILMHVVVNLFGGVIAPLAVSALDTEGIDSLRQLINANAPVPDELIRQVLPGLVGFIMYNLVFYGLVAAGIIIFIFRFRRIRFRERPDKEKAPSGPTAMLLNLGTVLFIVFSVLNTGKNLFL